MYIEGSNSNLNEQIENLRKITYKNEFITEVFAHSAELKLPNWYVGAGCIAQTVWNSISDVPPSQNIKDIDLVYFDSSKLSAEAEAAHRDRIQKLLHNLPINLDVKNQARVHLWYKEYFGYNIDPYDSVESAINTWPTTATCLAVKLVEQRFIVYAPYGLNDLFSMIVRPNKTQITKEIYENKIKRWKKCWPKLEIMPW